MPENPSTIAKATGAISWISLGASVASFAYSRHKRKKAKKERLANAALLGTPGVVGDPIFVACGYTAAEATPVYLRASNTLRTDRAHRLPEKHERSFGTFIRSNGNNRNEFLLVQYVLCQGGIEDITQVFVDGRRIDYDDGRKPKMFGLAFAEWGGDGDHFPNASLYTNERNSESKFTGLTAINVLYRQDLVDRPFLTNPPRLTCYVTGGQFPVIGN